MVLRDATTWPCNAPRESAAMNHQSIPQAVLATPSPDLNPDIPEREIRAARAEHANPKRPAKDEPVTPSPTEDSKAKSTKVRTPADTQRAIDTQKAAVPGKGPKNKGSVG
jgi:hypothetical protein